MTLYSHTSVICYILTVYSGASNFQYLRMLLPLASIKRYNGIKKTQWTFYIRLYNIRSIGMRARDVHLIIQELLKFGRTSTMLIQQALIAQKYTHITYSFLRGRGSLISIAGTQICLLEIVLWKSPFLDVIVEPRHQV